MKLGLEMINCKTSDRPKSYQDATPFPDQIPEIRVGAWVYWIQTNEGSRQKSSKDREQK